MSKRSIVIIFCMLLLLAGSACNSKLSIEPNNNKSFEAVITNHYLREDMVAAKACFEAWAPFKSVYLDDICDMFKFKPQCKRKVDENNYYYILSNQNHSYRCFIFVDEDDEIQEMLVVGEFLAMEHFVTDYELYGEGVNNLWKYKQAAVFAGNSVAYILYDGVAILPNHAIGADVLPKYFSDEEWFDTFRQYEAIYILPIDRKA